jgi:hypothetical protein
MASVNRLSIVALLFAVTVGFAQDLSEPPGYGVYYKAGENWQKLDNVSPLNSSVGAFSGATLNYNGASALLQLANHRPVFYVDRVPTARSMVIVTLERKKDHREIKVIRGGIFGAKGGPDRKHLSEVVIQSVNDHVVTVTPNQNLAPGEYLLTDSGGYSGYEFGINDTAPENPAAPESLKSSESVAREVLLKTINASFAREGVAGYGEIAGDKLTIHSERASAMRLHMLTANEKLLSMISEAGIVTLFYTNDADQNFAYDVKAGKVVLPSAPQGNESK